MCVYVCMHVYVVYNKGDGVRLIRLYIKTYVSSKGLSLESILHTCVNKLRQQNYGSCDVNGR